MTIMPARRLPRRKSSISVGVGAVPDGVSISGLWSDGRLAAVVRLRGGAPRYASADRNIGFGPDPQGGLAHRQGRPQIRPSYLGPGHANGRPSSTPTIISQCNTLFCDAACQRPATRRWLALGGSRTPAANFAVVRAPRLGTREVLCFRARRRWRCPTRPAPSRKVPLHQLPRSEATISTPRPSIAAGHEHAFSSAPCSTRWARCHLAPRRAQRSHDQTSGRPAPPRLEPRRLGRSADGSSRSMGLDPDRFSLLKKPAAG